ncbi:iron-sulfur cluster carrier protein [Marinobacterium nitratireducens]|uniref:Iron-sulfur cluster carrier protein n=1 Tax=Marinobacterium nitratireducens TaxID=518897 RepID=A0A917ZA54_9GAMM|nr:iron-sulfur cluster carrier protein ApbC [Marinobacterium nitratireducens]GGO79426.1 iron-sulfur cluster carrier protein [Marinobacterium nitratireducens]
MQQYRERIETTLSQQQDAVLGRDLASAGALTEVREEDGRVLVVLTLGYPCADIREALAADLSARLGAALDREVRVEIRQQIRPHEAQGNLPNLAGVRNIIAVASGKGGVGKSTTTINLALAMARAGARVGVLDADIYGPSLGLMVGVAPGTHPESDDGKYFKPIPAQGLQTMSMAYLIDETTPMVWRGPMVSGALQQLLTQTRWDDLDYLFIDMPPGTGDVQLTLSQKVPVTGSVIVTTPQDIALLDARKGIEMFRKVGIPVLGIVENMSTHICSNCGHEEHIFGAGGGERIAVQYDTELLGSLPLSLQIREQTDSGRPTAAADPGGAPAQAYLEIARRIAGRIASRNETAGPMPNISVEND